MFVLRIRSAGIGALPGGYMTDTASASQLRRRLSLPDVIAQSVTVIAPGMSGAFLTYLAATKAGGATPLAYVLAMLGALAVGSVVSEFGKTMPSAGSLYTYTSAGLSKTAGFVLGWMYSIAFIILAGAVIAGFGFFMSLLIQSLTDSADFVPWWIFFIIGLIFVAVMSLFDVKVSTRSQLLLTVISVVIMVVAALAIIGKGTPANSLITLDDAGVGLPTAQAGKSIDLGAFWPSAAGVSWSGILLGFAFGMLSFTGFEAGAVLAEETENPKKNIPKAVIGSVLVGGVFYILVTYATSIGFGVREAAADWPGSLSGLAAVAGNVNAGMGDLVLLAAAISALFCGLGVHTAASRFLFAMGREHVLPSALGKTHPKWQTPWNAILGSIVLYAVLIWGLLLVTSSATESNFSGGLPTGIRGGFFTFAYWATLATPGVMFCYLLVGLAGIKKGIADGNQKLTITGVLASITGAIAVFGSLYYSFTNLPPDPGIKFILQAIPAVMGVLLVAGLAIAAYLKSSKKEAWANMGAVFDEG
jgi:amino acid transporter